MNNPFLTTSSIGEAVALRNKKKRLNEQEDNFDAESKLEVLITEPTNADDKTRLMNDVHEAHMGNNTGITPGGPRPSSPKVQATSSSKMNSSLKSNKNVLNPNCKKMEIDKKPTVGKRQRKNSSATDTEITS